MARVTPRAGPDAGIQVIERVAELLRVLHGEPNGLSLSQLAGRTNLPRSTVHRLVSSLIHEGFLASASPNGRVRIGPELKRLASSPTDLAVRFRPIMQTLYEEFDETISCSVLDADLQRCIAQIEAPHRLRTEFPVGATLPLYNTANGKAILAQLESDEVTRILPARLARTTPNTITNRQRLVEELATIRAQGVAFDGQERAEGVRAAAVAIREGDAVVSICIAAPALRFDGREDAIAKALLDARASMTKA